MFHLFSKTKKNLKKRRFLVGLFFPLFIFSLFLFDAHGVNAGAIGSNWNPANWAGNAFYAGMQYFLYAVFLFVGLFTSVATTMFAYCVDPQFISGPSGLLNLQATYDMWKFVRDFINIFFILGLLFIAFAFVFQIESYSNSKAIIKLIIAALLVNFSFPIARIIIDLANVPMYFFLQMILGDGADASTALASSLGASNLQSILLPNGTNSTVTTLLAGIVFLFIFNITLLVLAFQFLIRVIALVILVILSPVGFVAGGIPGMKKYGTSWWDNFLKYCFFGPAAMFMLVLATNFFAAISGTGSQVPFVGETASVTSSDSSMTAAMVLFFVPITMLWFTMGLSSKFSIAGAAVATKYGKDFANWTKKKTYNNRVGRGIKKGATDRLEKTPVLKNFMPKYAQQNREAQQAWVGGLVSGGRSGARKDYNKAQDKFHAKRVAEEEKKMEEERTSESALRLTMNDANADKAKREAAAKVLSKKDALRTGSEMQQALDAIALSNGAKVDSNGKVDQTTLTASAKEKQAELVKKAGGEIYQSGKDLASAIELLGDDVKGVGALVEKANSKALDLSSDEYQSIAKTNPNVKGKLDSKLKKEGKVKVLIEAEIKEQDSLIKTGIVTEEQLFQERFSKMSAKEIGKIDGMHGDSSTAMNTKLEKFIRAQIDSENWSGKDHQDAFSELSSEQKEVWRRNGLAPKK